MNIREADPTDKTYYEELVLSRGWELACKATLQRCRKYRQRLLTSTSMTTEQRMNHVSYLLASRELLEGAYTAAGHSLPPRIQEFFDGN